MNARLDAGTADVVRLPSLRKGDRATVHGLAETPTADMLAMKRRLLELGFVPGETVRIVAESFPRRAPIAVRVGNTTFALRRHEAAMVEVVRAGLPQGS